MQCVDDAEFPTSVTHEKDTFEDEVQHAEASNKSQLLVCGYHPKAPDPVSLEIQELNWQRCKRIYDILLIIAIFVVVLIHLQFLIDILCVKVKRAYHKQTHLHVEEEEKEETLNDKQKPTSMAAKTSPSPIVRTSTSTSSTVEDRQLPKGMTQEDYIEFERYEHFIYAHARDL
ncbi:hypothetical protein Aperf_G00000129145 [Anoplocephala perfoliata]